MTVLLVKLLLRWGVPQKFAGIAADAIIVLLVAGAIWYVHHSIWQSGYDARTAEYDKADEEAEDQAQADSWTLVGDISGIDGLLSDDFTETQKTRTIYRDRIRTVAVDVYRDRVCDLPAGVWNDLNAIRAHTASPFAGADQ